MRRSLVRLVAMSSEALSNPVETLITSKLSLQFRPSHLDIVNESYKHSVPKGSESHFKVVIVSDQFEGKSLVERHRMVNHCLGEELKQSIHALSIQAKTPSQWAENSTIANTPPCLGGSKA